MALENAERMREDHKRRVAALQQLGGHRTDCLRYATHLADVDELEGAATAPEIRTEEDLAAWSRASSFGSFL